MTGRRTRGAGALWRQRFARLGAWLVVLLLLWGQVEAAGWRAGVARVKITPEQSMWMAGYASRTRPAEGTLTDLWAKALVIEQPPAERAVIVTLDLIGIDRDLAARIAGQLQQRYGFERRQIAFCCSHTHSGPVLAGNLRPLHYLRLPAVQRQRIDAYTQWLEGAVVQLVGRAVADLRPATLAWGSGRATFAVNRRENREADVPELRARGALKGPSDHDVPVLAVRDAAQKLRAVLFGYACHATVLDQYRWSGDYPGMAQREFERAHPEATALFWAGCGGDQNPLPRRTVERAREYGRQLAAAVDRVLAEPIEPVAESLKCKYREIPLKLADLPTREALVQQAASTNPYTATRAKMLLEQIATGRSLSDVYPYPVATWKLGQIEMVFLGGEVVVDYAVRLKVEGHGPRTWVAAYSNDVMAYIPSRRVLAEGGYEGGGAMVYYGLPGVWGPLVEETIVTEVHRQLADP